MKAVILLCISLAVCIQARTVRQASDPPSTSTSTPPPSTATPSTTTLAQETSSSNGNSTSNVTSTSEQPAVTVEQYYDHILQVIRDYN